MRNESVAATTAASHDRDDHRLETGLLLVILLFGFALRLHTIGRDSLRLDEAGQALAARQPNWAGMIAIERTHAMAMPLDYVVTRLSGTVSADEFVLRLPAALWGTLSLALAAVLARRLAGRETAIVAVFLMAISPVLLQYSQELRFYAALVAFYLLSIILLFTALRAQSWRSWMIYVLATGIGAYFHPFVLSSILTGAVYLVFEAATQGVRRVVFGRFLLAGLALAVLFWPGYRLFGAHQDYAFELFQWGGDPVDVISRGLDWTGGATGGGSSIAAIARPLSLLFAGIGFVMLLGQWRRRRPFLSLVIGSILAIGAVLLANVVKGYWFLPRQLLHLMPVAVMLVAFGLVSVAQVAARFLRPGKQQTAGRVAITAALTLVLALSIAETVTVYYALPRGLGREMMTAIRAADGDSQTVLIMPAFDRQLYEYYWTNDPPAGGSRLELVPVEWADLPATTENAGGTTYLIIRGTVSGEQQALLQDLDYARFVEPRAARDGVYQVFVRGKQNG